MAPAYPPVDVDAQDGQDQIPTTATGEPDLEYDDDTAGGWHSYALARDPPIPAGMHDVVTRDRESARMVAEAMAKQAAMGGSSSSSSRWT